MSDFDYKTEAKTEFFAKEGQKGGIQGWWVCATDGVETWDIGPTFCTTLEAAEEAVRECEAQ